MLGLLLLVSKVKQKHLGHTIYSPFCIFTSRFLDTFTQFCVVSVVWPEILTKKLFLLYIHRVFSDPGGCYGSVSLLARWTFRGQTASMAIKKQCLTLLMFHLPFTWKLMKEVRTFHWFNFSLCWWNRYTQAPFLISSGNTAYSSISVKCRVQFWA